MTDKEIVEAMPFLAKYCKNEYNDIRVDEVLLGAYDLINRQKADLLHLRNKVELLEQDKKMSKEDSDKSKAAAMEVIKKQEAEIERLKHLEKNVYEAVEELTNKIKAEAVKEFAERLKETGARNNAGLIIFVESDIDNLAKEMVGEG